MPETPADFTRRRFLNVGLATAVAVGSGARLDAQAAESAARTDSAEAAAQNPASLPWYRRAYRWGQTNITEKDPIRYDIEWWRAQWRRTQVQALIINAGGIVAYYPSKFPLHHRAEFLGGRDLFGELTKAAHEDGLFVMARMDSNRTDEDFLKAHPDWFTRDRTGQPYRADDKYITCINSAYYDEYLPDVMREIIERSHPDGFTDNSWAGLGRSSICYCANCETAFKAYAGAALPQAANWDDPVYRKWITWNYARRVEIWDMNNRVTRAAGGPDCVWSGMMGGAITAQSRSFRDLRAICARADIMMLDHQRRDDNTGFQQNGDTGKRVHGIMGWDKLAPESMALYETGPGYYRVATKPAAEARQWMFAGIAGGIQPWWHHIGAYHDDRRMYRTAEPVMRWHKANERYLVNRAPVATVGLVWSQQNTDFFGRDEAAQLVDGPYTGFMHALVRARVPYLSVHVDDIGREAGRLATIILPNVGALSDAQAAGIRRFVEGGGSLIATGHTSLFDEWGVARPDFALADLFACHLEGEAPRTRGAAAAAGNSTADVFAPDASGHTYLRLTPELRGRVDGPNAGDEPAITGERHPVLHGFDETDIIAYGGTLKPLRVEPGATVPLTFVPAFPTYPPETAWMRVPKTTIPGLILSQHGRGKVAYMPADIDRRYALEHLPDHATLLGNTIRWACGAAIPLSVEGTGFIDCHLFEQPGRMILHLVNLTSEATWRAPLDELIKVGPFRVTVKHPQGLTPRSVRLLVAGKTVALRREGAASVFTVDAILDHEVVLVE